MIVSKHRKQASIFNDEHDLISRLFVGHWVERFGSDLLQLDNGTTFRVVPNTGDGEKTGRFWISHIQTVEGTISEVVHVVKRDVLVDAGGKRRVRGDRFSVVVETKSGWETLLEVDGYPDDGMHGEGFSLVVQLDDLPADLRP